MDSSEPGADRTGGGLLLHRELRLDAMVGLTGHGWEDVLRSGLITDPAHWPRMTPPPQSLEAGLGSAPIGFPTPCRL